MKRLFLLILAIMFLSACGGDEQEGVSLQVADQAATPTPSPSPEPTAAPDSAPALAGRLLILRGQQFEMLDLATGDMIPLASEGEAPNSFSPVNLNHARTHGTFFAFPDFGILDLTTNEIKVLRNTSSNAFALQPSPDGQWMATIGGQFRTQLRLIDLAGDGTDAQVVASSADTGFAWGWTSDSDLVWWETVESPKLMIFDPVSGESAPVNDDSLELTTGNALLISPDGAYMANIPLAPGAEAAGGDPDLCFDSYVELFDLPFTSANTNPESETIWTENGLVASSPQWPDEKQLLFIRLGSGTCGDVQGDADRSIMILDITADEAEPRTIAGPLGNADDPNDRTQNFGRQYGHLYSPSPDGRYVAWIGGGLDARESMINVTDVQTGETFVVLETTESDAYDLADYIENQMLRQVVWLK